MILTQFDIIYVSQKVIKGKALADFLVAHPIPNDSSLVTEPLDEEVMVTKEVGPHWEMYFDELLASQPYLRVASSKEEQVRESSFVPLTMAFYTICILY